MSEVLPRTRVALVAGFLGAGKTTAIIAAAHTAAARGLKTGVVTNDQASGLVDTASMRVARVEVAEVAGGCFCCRFSDLVNALDQLLAHRPDIIFCEAVGSCTDLAATVIRPLQQFYGELIDIAPLTVLVDRERLLAPLPDDVRYLHGKQMEEAELLLLSKSDLWSDEHRHSMISARTGEGIEAWLAQLLGETKSSPRVLETIDYDTYARGEAALSWLNATASCSAAVSGERLLTDLRSAIRDAGMEPMQVKLHAGDALTVNARVIGDPETLRQVVADVLAKTGATIVDCASFRPAYPHPTYRMERA